MNKIVFFLSLVFSQSIHAQGTARADMTVDSLAIIHLLETESASWRSGDVAKHAACWLIQPYSRILISTGDGTVIDLPPVLMIDPPAGMMGKGGSSLNSNYKMKIAGSIAWVSHDEQSTSKEGSVSQTSEIRMLEKTTGGWKLVGQSIHVKKSTAPPGTKE